MSDTKELEPLSVTVSRKILTGALEKTVEGEVASVLLVLETASGELVYVRSPFKDTLRLTGMLFAVATELSQEAIDEPDDAAFLEGFEGDGFDEEDDDDEDEED